LGDQATDPLKPGGQPHPFELVSFVQSGHWLCPRMALTLAGRWFWRWQAFGDLLTLAGFDQVNRASRSGRRGGPPGRPESHLGASGRLVGRLTVGRGVADPAASGCQ
jgi:hypothetical protein